jgi:hypothetical protein
VNNRALLLPVIAYAAVGLVLSLFVHLLSFKGVALGGNTLVMGLHIGIFPLLFLVISLGKRRDGLRWGQSGEMHWKHLLVGCPAWMKYMTYGFFAYATVNTAIFFIGTAFGPKPLHMPGAPPAAVWHGCWMTFYSAGLAIATSLYRRGWAPTRCPNGHVVRLDDRLCAACGAPVNIT